MGLPDEQLIDVTELQAAIAALNGCEPPSGRAVVSAAVLSPISMRTKKEQEEASAEKEANPEVGDQMQDGSVYAGLTADGKRQIFAMPEDFDVKLTFNEAAKRVAELNADHVLGHDDWQIPTLKSLSALQKNQNEGKFNDTFSTKGEGYWSSTKYDYSDTVRIVFFPDGYTNWNYCNILLNCRAVRLAPVAPSPA